MTQLFYFTMKTEMDSTRTLVLIIISSICLQSLIYGKDVNLKPIQKDIFSDTSAVLKDIEQLYYNLKFEDNVLVITDDIESDNEKLCKILSRGNAVVVDLTYQPWAGGLDFISNIPYIRVDLMLSPVLEIFAEYLKEKSATDVALIFENEEDTEEALYHIIRGYPFRVIIINAAEDNFVQRLKTVRPSPSYVAIFATLENMNSIFEKINKARLFSRPREWHFVFLDVKEKTFKYNKQVEYATKFTINNTDLCVALGMKDSYCGSEFKLRKAVILEILKNVLEFLEANDSKLYLDYNYSNCNNSNIPQISFDPATIISDFLVMEENRITYTLNMSISSFSNDDDAMTNIAEWKSGELKKMIETISPARRFFRIGTAEAIPWTYKRLDLETGKTSLDEDGNPILEGYCIDFVKILSDYMNFDYVIVPPTSGTFGKRFPNGSWDGVVGDLVAGETDFVVAALKMTSEREEVIDFIAPYFEQTGISIVIRKAVRQTSLFKFMTVLRLEVWLSIVAALVVTAIMIWLLDKYSPYSARNNKQAYPYPCREFTLKESFWFALTSFTPQGGGEAPKAISGRILVAAYWLFVVLMLATFTANLAAFLTVERMQTPVQSLEQLARQSRINYTVVEGSDTHKYFINMKFAEDTLYRLWKELSLNATSDQSRYRIWNYPIKEQYGHILLAINTSNPVKNAAEGFQKVNEHENADFAFIHDSAEIKYELTKNCNLTEVGEVFAEQPYAIAIQQGSHLSDELSYAILELQKERYFEELSAKYWNHSLIKSCSRTEDQEGITLESLGGVFIATLFGLALAMVTLAAEVVYYRKKGKPFVVPVREVIPIASVTGITPPPTFEVATVRGRTIPDKITLGNKFKPINKRKKKITYFPSPTKISPQMYYE